MKAHIAKLPVEKLPESHFDDWEWGDADLEPLLKHIRRDTAKIIADQIADDCEGHFYEWDGLFHVQIWADFLVTFDVLGALAAGEIAFDDIDELRAFSAKIDAVSANLHKAIEAAEETLS